MKKIIWMVTSKVNPLLRHDIVLEYKEQLDLTTYTTKAEVDISKCLRKGFSILKMYHSHSNSFHHSNIQVFDLFGVTLIRINP